MNPGVRYMGKLRTEPRAAVKFVCEVCAEAELERAVEILTGTPAIEPKPSERRQYEATPGDVGVDPRIAEHAASGVDQQTGSGPEIKELLAVTEFNPPLGRGRRVVMPLVVEDTEAEVEVAHLVTEELEPPFRRIA